MKIILKPFIDFIKKYYILILLFGLYILVTYLLKMPNCLIKLICGYPCPGCGLTREGFAVLRLDFVAAVHFNPLIFVLPLVLLVIIYKEYSFFKKLYYNKFFWSLLVLLAIGLYVYRMIVIYPNVPMNYDDRNLIKRVINIFR